MGDTRSSFLDTVVGVGIGVIKGRGVPESDVAAGSGAVLPVHARAMRSTMAERIRVVMKRDGTRGYLPWSWSVGEL